MKRSYIFLIIFASLCTTDVGAVADKTFSDEGGILYTEPLKAVIFRHEDHVDGERITCAKCHSGLFEMKALSVQKKEDFTMDSLYDGKYCGACHNGEDAFASDLQCTRCHVRLSDWYNRVGFVSGKPVPYKLPVYNTSLLLGRGEMQVRFNHEKHSPPDCMGCHSKLFRLKKGSNNITLVDHNPQKYCFGCHDGKETFSWYNCERCHKNWKGIAGVVPLKSKFGRGSCYKCHTDAKEMKSLVKAPAIRGEGEG